jgi:glyoxylase I family protein
VTPVSHLSLSVTDLDRSLAFYRDVLGAPVLAAPYDGEPQFKGRIALVLIGAVGLDLQEHADNTGEPFDPDHTGLDHLAFSVESRHDLERWAGLLDEAGVAHSPLRDAGPGTMFDFQDPDGIQLEFYFLDPTRPLAFTA